MMIVLIPLSFRFKKWQVFTCQQQLKRSENHTEEGEEEEEIIGQRYVPEEDKTSGKL